MRWPVIGGMRVSVHPGLLPLLAVALWAGMAREVALFFLVLLGHELAHLLLAAAFDLRITSLEILPFGGVAEVEGLELADPGVEAAVAMAGPLHNLLWLAIAVLLRHIGWLAGPRGSFFLLVNAALAVGNLLPGLPLDGGRVARAVLATRQGSGPATAALLRVGRGVAAGLALVGAVLLVRGVLVPGLFIFAFFIWTRARAEREVARMRPWRELSRRAAGLGPDGLLPVQPLAVEPDLPLRRVVDRFLPRRYHLLWLVSPGGGSVGPWDEAAIWEALRRVGAAARGRDLAAVAPPRAAPLRGGPPWGA